MPDGSLQSPVEEDGAIFLSYLVAPPGHVATFFVSAHAKNNSLIKSNEALQ